MNVDVIYTQQIADMLLTKNNLLLDVLRLDVMHDVVSGNKWFKLKYYLEDAAATGFDTIATFGGAFSNHIVATAYAARQKGFKSVGIIRGEEAENLSPTLLFARQLGMRLIFVTREAYQHKKELENTYNQPGWYFVSEGGYGVLGAKGCSEILSFASGNYTHIVASVGTGTMLAGLISSALVNQKIIGISSMKANVELENNVNKLLINNTAYPAYKLLHNYHFGGYAKHPAALIAFINMVWKEYQLPLDIVYTGKLFFAILDLIKHQYFAEASKILMIHSGGLQGNKSLAANRLLF